MRNLCAQCNICSFVKVGERTDLYEKLSRDEFVTDGSTPRILVIAEAGNERVEILQLMNIEGVLADIPYTYTRVVRCEYEPMPSEQMREAESRCAVWTHHLLSGRSLIITVPKGLRQMGIEGKNVGDLFRSGKYGVVLVVDRYNEIHKYQDKIQRALREAGISE